VWSDPVFVGGQDWAERVEWTSEVGLTSDSPLYRVDGVSTRDIGGVSGSSSIVLTDLSVAIEWSGDPGSRPLRRRLRFR